MNNIKTIIFDYDGTLHNSMKIYAPAFKKAYKYLVEKNLAPDKQWEDKDISRWLGYSSKDMWNEFMPSLDSEEKLKCSSIIGESMKEDILGGKAELYKGSIEILEYLMSKEYNLIFLSNCKVEYMEAHKKLFKLENYFDEMLCTEAFNFQPKHEIFNVIKENFPRDYIIIGDRFQDIEIALKHNIKSIGCSYGYGSPEELHKADIIIKDIRELSEIL